MGRQADWSGFAITPQSFIFEARHFREVAADLNLSAVEKRQAYRILVLHAGMLDPLARGYEDAGIALKAACSCWLECEAEEELADSANDVLEA